MTSYAAELDRGMRAGCSIVPIGRRNRPNVDHAPRSVQIALPSFARSGGERVRRGRARGDELLVRARPTGGFSATRRSSSRPPVP